MDDTNLINGVPVSLKVIWTYKYEPFTMGGNVWRVVKTVVQCLGPFPLGKGYSGYLAISPSGRAYVIEGETGAIVGYSIDGVRKDIEKGDDAAMRQQITTALQESKRAREMSSSDFWKMLARGKHDDEDE